jgi:hypothetical protein
MMEAVNPVSEAAQMNKRGMEEAANAQTVMMQGFQTVSRRWLERCQTEAQLLSELGAKLSASRSFADTAAAYQEFTQRHWEMANEDLKQVIADAEAFSRSGAAMFSYPAQPPM